MRCAPRRAGAWLALTLMPFGGTLALRYVTGIRAEIEGAYGFRSKIGSCALQVDNLELNGSWQDVAYTAIAFKLIATATKYIEGTLEQTVLQPACCQDPFSSDNLKEPDGALSRDSA